MRRTLAIALACLVAIAILSAMWITGRGHEIADPNAFRNMSWVTPVPTLDQRPLRVDVEQRTIAPVPLAESVSHVEPLADASLLIFNHKADDWEIRDFSGAHLETLAVPPIDALLISPDRRRLAHVGRGALMIYDLLDRTTVTTARGIDTGADVRWSPQGDRLVVLSAEGGGSSTLLVVQAADGVVLIEKTWVDGEDVYLEEWTIAEALRVRVWADGGCNPWVPQPCLPGTSTLFELGGSGLTEIEAVSDDISYYCGIDVSTTRCIPYEEDASDTTTSVMVPDNAISEAPSPDGLYVAILIRQPPDKLYLRLVKNSDKTFADISVPLNDVSLEPTWSVDSRFVYLSVHAACMLSQPRGC